MRPVPAMLLLVVLVVVSACAAGRVSFEQAQKSPAVQIVFVDIDPIDGFKQLYGQALADKFVMDGFNATLTESNKPVNSAGSFVLYISRSATGIGNNSELTCRLFVPDSKEIVGVYSVVAGYPDGILDRFISVGIGASQLYNRIRKGGGLVAIVAASYPEGSPERERELKRARALSQQRNESMRR